MVGEIFENYISQMTGNAFKFSIMVGFKFSTMVGEIFEIYISQMARMAFKLSTMVGENLKFTSIKWLEWSLNCPPWFGENFEIYIVHYAWRIF